MSTNNQSIPLVSATGHIDHEDLLEAKSSILGVQDKIRASA